MPTPTITEQFSKRASTYNTSDTSQRVAFEEISNHLPAQANTILDLGCGTGTHTRTLATRYPNAHITGIDASSAMINNAINNNTHANISFEIADITSYQAKQTPDLIVSNATLHWLSAPTKSILNLYKTISDDGSVIFTYYGPDTFKELQQSISLLLNRHIKLAAQTFYPISDIIKALQAELPTPVLATEKRIIHRYDTLRDLLKIIQNTGTAGNKDSQLPKIWTKNKLDELEQLYRNEFGQISVTTQFFTIKITKKST